MNITFLKFFSSIILTLLTSLCLANDDVGGSIKDTAKSAVSSIVSMGKNLMGGINEGVDAGRQSTLGADGAMIISSHESMAGKLSAEIIKVEQKDETLHVVVGFKNATDALLRVINLKQTGSLLAIDQAGYSNTLRMDHRNPDEVNVPPMSAIRQTFIFECENEPFRSLRLWGQDYSAATPTP